MAKKTPSPASATPRAAGRKKAAAKQKPAAGKLITEIKALLPKLDEPGLAFIKRQAEVLVATDELARGREETIKAIERISTRETARTDSKPAEPKPAVGIEQKQENAFFIRTYGKRIFFNRNEMRALAKVCHAADNPVAGARRLHVWLKRERADYLIDTGITGPGDPALRMLWEQVVQTYAPPA